MQLNYRAQGQGVPVVIAHGLFGSASNWQTIARGLSQQFRVLTVDLRNHGGSPHDAAMDYASMAADLGQFIDVHCGGNAAVVGHSMGGKAAMSLALLHPQRVRALGVLDVAPVAYDRARGLSRYTAAMQAVPLDQIHSRKEADDFLSAAVPEAGLRTFLLHNLRLEPKTKSWCWRLNLPVLAAALDTIADFPYHPGEYRYVGPSCFIKGQRSDYVLAEYWPNIEQLFPAARLEQIADAGHWLHAEQPAAVQACLLEFLSAHRQST